MKIISCVLVAVEGEDYNLTNTVITFPNTSVVGAAACTTFTITDDSILELDKEFRIQITSPTDPPGLTISAQSSTTVVTIEDNEGKSSVVNHIMPSIKLPIQIPIAKHVERPWPQ